MTESFDVVVIGGGPAGSTVGSLLKKHAPQLSVGIFEKEVFPREHIGESLLPTVGRIMDEIGVWDDVEKAGFPIKIGATYKWGTTDDLWDFNLLDTREIVADAPRPGKFEGWRARTAWQVNRSSFDEILLNKAESLGCVVSQGAAVVRVEVKDGAISSVQLSDGRTIEGRTFVDASGNAAVLRKALRVEVAEPPSLRNIAVWNHWDNADWAVSIGTVATRVQVTSLGYGWIWFIPISATSTSIGLVCPAEYYKRSGKSMEELYTTAVREDPRVAALISDATPSGKIRATKDWSFLAKSMVGKNWYLAGESAGFADPILAAGISLTMVGALECAYTIVECERGELPADWLKGHYEKRQTQRLEQHIKFANFWYSANAHFTDLMEYTTEIARDAGLDMDAKAAWQWLGTGGFVSLETAGAGLAGHSLEQIANLESMMFAEESMWQITKYNVFQLRLEGAEVDKLPLYREGRIRTGKLVRKNGKELPLTGGFRFAFEMLQKELTMTELITHLRAITAKMGPVVALSTLEAVETMLRDGWVVGLYDPSQPLLRQEDIPRTPNVDWNRDEGDPKVQIAQALKA